MKRRSFKQCNPKNIKLNLDDTKSEFIRQGLVNYGLTSDLETVSSLFLYLSLLTKWNKVYNLTAVKGFENLFYRNVLDSLQLARLLENPPKGYIIDIGSGAGLPGIPLKLFLDMRLLSVEKVGKKVDFQKYCKARMNLDGFEADKIDVQKYADFHSELADAVISRSFSDLGKLLKISADLLKAGGKVYAWNNNTNICPFYGQRIRI